MCLLLLNSALNSAKVGQVWWHMSVSSALGRLRQEDLESVAGQATQQDRVSKQQQKGGKFHVMRVLP
jgi:hypothetical protein